MQEDWELLDAWRAGDAEAGNELVTRHFSSVSRFFRNKLGDDVDDPIQQTFLACVEGRDTIAGKSFRAYLFAVARRRLYDQLRRNYKNKDLDFALSSIADLGTTPSQLIAKNQRSQLLHTALSMIPLESQIALELAYWEGLSGAEIAIALDIEPATVRSRLTRSRAKLREQVESLGGDSSALFGDDGLQASDLARE